MKNNWGTFSSWRPWKVDSTSVEGRMHQPRQRRKDGSPADLWSNKTMPEEEDIHIDRHKRKAISINLRSLRRRWHRKKKGGERKRCVAEGRRDRTHALKFLMSEVRESMIGRTFNLRLRKNSRKSITDTEKWWSHLVLLAGREEASGPPR